MPHKKKFKEETINDEPATPATLYPVAKKDNVNYGILFDCKLVVLCAWLLPVSRYILFNGKNGQSLRVIHTDRYPDLMDYVIKIMRLFKSFALSFALVYLRMSLTR